MLNLARALFSLVFQYIQDTINTSLALAGTGPSSQPSTPTDLVANASSLTSNGPCVSLLDLSSFVPTQRKAKHPNSSPDAWQPISDSLLQLCRNYCNEHLAVHFNLSLFQSEKSVYAREQLDTKLIPWLSNETALTLFDGVSSQGLLGLVNDESVLMPEEIVRGQGIALCRQVRKERGERERIQRLEEVGGGDLCACTPPIPNLNSTSALGSPPFARR